MSTAGRGQGRGGRGSQNVSTKDAGGVVTPKKPGKRGKTLGVPSRTSPRLKRIEAVHDESPDPPPVQVRRPKTKGGKFTASKGTKVITVKKSVPDDISDEGEFASDVGEEDSSILQNAQGNPSPSPLLSSSQKLHKIRDILIQAGQQEDDMSIDSDDQLSGEEGAAGNSSQLTMEGDNDYRQMQGEESEEHTVDLTKQHMVPEYVDYSDPDKPLEKWWTEDPTREETLCALWQDEKCLYDMTDNIYRVPDHKDVLIRKFASVLQMPPPIIHMRMTSLRSMYQKMQMAAPSGAAAVGKTPRQKEICRLVGFLSDHVKSTPSITSYKGKSPGKGKKKYSYQQKVTARRTKVPKKNAELDSRIDIPLNESLSPIVRSRDVEPTPSEEPSDEEQDDMSNAEMPANNTKHFGRNNRLLDENIVLLSAKKSLRLTDSPTPARANVKTVHTPLVKKSLKRSRGDTDGTDTPTSHKNPKRTPKTLVITEGANSKQEDTMEDSNKIGVNVKSTPRGKTVTTNSKVPKKASTPKPDNQVAGCSKDHPEETETAADRFRWLMGLVQKADEGKQAKVNLSKETLHGVEVYKKDYGVAINPHWYEEQGSEYRRLKEAHLAKKKENTSLVSAMREKTAVFQQMANTMAQSNSAPIEPIQANKANSPEQLWADSLVLHMRRMPEEVRDQYMYHVLGLAFKAIKGTWPPK